MPKRFGPPRRNLGHKDPIGILELDRFSEATLNRWREISSDLDELQAVLYFNLLPEHGRVRDQLLAAINTADLQLNRPGKPGDSLVRMTQTVMADPVVWR